MASLSDDDVNRKESQIRPNTSFLNPMPIPLIYDGDVWWCAKKKDINCEIMN